MPSSARPAQGSLADCPFACLLASLRREGFTGVLQISAAPPPGEESAGGDPADDQDETAPTREIHFASGHIAWAISTDRDESLKAFLVRHGTITPQQWDEAEDRARQETLRQALTGMGLIAARELTRLESSRVEEIISRLFSVGAGTFRVRERQLPPGTPDLEIDASALLINGVMETADRSFLESATGSLDAVFSLAGPSPDDALLERLRIRGEFQAILKHVDGVKSVGEICSLTSLPDHFVRCVFAALSLLDCVQRAGDPAPAAPERATQATPPPSRPVALPMARVEPAPPVTMTPATADLPAAVPVAPIRRIEPEEPRASSIALAAKSGEEEAPRSVERFAFDARDTRDMDSGASSSVYESQASETSRGWFLVGAAMAVGLAAVFLILFARDRGDTMDLGRETADAALEPRDTDAVPPGALVSGPAVRSHGASLPAAGPARNPVPPTHRDPVDQPAGSAAGLASAPRTPILPTGPAAGSAARTVDPQEARTTAARPRGPADPTGLSRDPGTLASRERLAHLEQRNGGWSIQILLACEEATIDRAVRQSGQSAELFVLPVTHEGRACHRVYWGRYADRAGAEYALRNDVPNAYRTGGARPWVTRLPS